MRMATAALVLTAFQVAAGEVVPFDPCDSGGLPPHWSVGMTHSGRAPRWGVVKDPSAPSPPCVFAKLSTDSTAGRFPLAIWAGADFRDGEVAVAFKPVAGAVDQAAGIVWRYRDPDNYYIVRANALENNVVLYKVQNGVRASIPPHGLPSRAYGVKHFIASGRWARLRVRFQGASFTIFLNGEKLFAAEDGSIRSAGKTGLWTKADSVTYFDNFEVRQK
jgi:hypothetical protein